MAKQTFPLLDIHPENKSYWDQTQDPLYCSYLPATGPLHWHSGICVKSVKCSGLRVFVLHLHVLESTPYIFSLYFVFNINTNIDLKEFALTDINFSCHWVQTRRHSVISKLSHTYNKTTAILGGVYDITRPQLYKSIVPVLPN